MEKKVLTTCPYCGAGCQFYLVVDEAKNKILEVNQQMVERMKALFA